MICKRISLPQFKLHVGYLECWVHRLSAEGMIHEGSPKQPQLTPRHCTDLWVSQKKTPNLAWLNRSVVRFVWGIHSRSGLKLRQKAMGGPTTNSPPQSITCHGSQIVGTWDNKPLLIPLYLAINIVKGMVETVVWQFRQSSVATGRIPHFCSPGCIPIIASSNKQP